MDRENLAQLSGSVICPLEENFDNECIHLAYPEEQM